MAEAFMAYPELRHPFEEKPVNPDGSKTILYAGRVIQVTQTSDSDHLQVPAEELPGINGFELKPEGACYQETCIQIGRAHV